MTKALIAALAAVFLLMILISRATPDAVQQPAKTEASKPILRMELAGGVSARNAVVGADSKSSAWKGMADAQYLDCFFIPAYAVLLSVCALINARGSRFWTLVAFAAIVLITSAAIADYYEDARILHLLDRDGLQGFFPPWWPTDHYPRPWALWKWGLFAASIAVTGVLIAGRTRRWRLRVLGVAITLPGVGLIAAAAIPLADRVIDNIADAAFLGLTLLVVRTAWICWGSRAVTWTAKLQKEIKQRRSAGADRSAAEKRSA